MHFGCKFSQCISELCLHLGISRGRMRGHYHFNTVPQGSIISTAVFQEWVDVRLSPLYDEGVGSYIDDIYVFSDTFEDHLNTMEKLFDILDENDMTVGIKKCQLFKSEVSLLGF